MVRVCFIMMDNIDETNNNPAMNNLLLIFGCMCASRTYRQTVIVFMVINESRPVSVFMEDDKHKDSFNGQFFKST